MSQSIMLHNCTGVSLEQHTPDNGNSLTLQVKCAVSGDVLVSQYECKRATFEQRTEITFFGLPTEVTDALIKALAKWDKR